MNAVVWRLRWRVAGSRRRLLAWNVLVPLILLLPVVLSPAAAPHRAAVVGVFIAFFGTFGSCIPLVRDRQRGWTEKVWLTGYGPRRWLVERMAAEASLDFLELTPVLVLAFLAAAPAPAAGAASLATALPAVALALITANLLGALVAAVVTSIAEAALACGAAALFALHFSGLFRLAAPGTWAWHVERAGPFRPLAGALREGLSGATTGWPAVDTWPGPVLAVAALLVLTLAVAPRLARRSMRPD